MYRIVTAILCVLLWAGGLQGAKEIEFNVMFDCGWDGFYRPMEWTPVEVGISSDLKEPFDGYFSLSTQQDGLNTLNVAQRFVLMPDVTHAIPLVSKFTFGAGDCELMIRDERQRVRWQHARTMWDFSTGNRLLRAVHEQDLLIGLIGPGHFGLMRLPKETICMCSRGNNGQVYVGAKLARAAPWDWTGYVSLDLLVLCDPDWSLFRTEQVKAICDWISNGGAALLVLGRHPLPQDSPLKAAIPFQIGSPMEVEIPSRAMESWGLDARQTQTVMAWPLSVKPDVSIGGEVQLGTASLYGTGHLGFGRISVLAFDPAQFSEAQSERSAAFWARQIAAGMGAGGTGPLSGQPVIGSVGRGRAIALTPTTPQGNAPTGYNPNISQYRISVAQTAANQVMNYLFELRQMQPLSIWWVILTLMALAVLLGPVDYLVLKRLDRQPLTWLTSTGWIVLFTVGAYYGVQWLRAGSMELRAVTVFDGVADSNCTWATCYAGVFAPRSDNYQLEGLTSNQWWSGIAPMQEQMWAHQRESGVRQIKCRQADGGNLPVSLPISIWTVQSLLCEWTPKEMPFRASIERSESGTTVEIVNTSGSAIRVGYVLFKDCCGDLGAVPAHSTKRFAVRTRPFQPWPGQGGFSGTYDPARPPNMGPGMELPRMPAGFHGATDNAFFAQGCLDRTLGMYSCLDSGAAMVCVTFEGAPPPFAIKNRSYAVNHIQYARQLVPLIKDN